MESNVEISKIKVRLTLELSELTKERERLERVLQQEADLRQKLYLLERNPKEYLENEAFFKRIELSIQSIGVHKDKQILVIND